MTTEDAVAEELDVTPVVPAIELRGISKAFGPVQANKNISISVKPGTIHGIIGENGAGKSTLMSILYGFYKADSGSIFINGRYAGTAPLEGIEIPSGKNDLQIRDGSDVLATGVLTVPKESDVIAVVRHP